MSLRILPIALFAVLLCPIDQAWAQTSEDLVGRIELNARAGNERVILMNEYWVPFTQSSDGVGPDSVIYGDVRLMGDDQSNREFNLGLGYRQVLGLPVLGSGIAGVHGWFDRRITDLGGRFNQATAGLEWLGEDWDIRANAYLPLSDAREMGTIGGGGGAAISGAYLAGTGIYYRTVGGSAMVEEPQPGFDLELGWRVSGISFADSTRLYAGGYYFEGDKSDDVSGWRARVAMDVSSDFQVGMRYQRDDERGSQGFLEATIRFPFGNKQSFKQSGVRARLDESPERDIDIVTGVKAQSTPSSVVPILNTTTGNAQRVIYVDNSAAGGGNGSIESPYNNLAAAQAGLQEHDVLYIANGTGNSVNLNTGLTLDKTGVYVIGEGSNFIYDNGRFTTGTGVNLDPIVLRTAGLAPVLTNAAANSDVITLAADNIFLTGLRIDGAQRHGIYSQVGTNETRSFQMQNLQVTNSAADGVRLEANGAAGVLNATLVDSRVTGNRNGLRLYAHNDASINASVQSVQASGNTQHGVIVYDDSTAGSIDADLGGGGRSTGYNALFANGLEDLALDLDGATLMAQNNWWGQAAGLYQLTPAGGLKPQIYFGAPINDGLVGHWTFDQEWMSNTTAYDRSGNNSHGTLTGLSLADMSAGGSREALNFNGVSSRIDLNVAGIDTASAGAKTTVLLNSNWNGAAPAMPFAWQQYDLFYVFNEYGFNTFTSDMYGVNAGGLNNRWIHNAAVFTNGDVYQNKLYFDGVDQALIPIRAPGVARNVTNQAAIGACIVGCDAGFTYSYGGRLDDVRIYNYELTAGEIAEIYRMNTSSVVDHSSHRITAP
jgi:hypothetical protein